MPSDIVQVIDAAVAKARRCGVRGCTRVASTVLEGISMSMPPHLAQYWRCTGHATAMNVDNYRPVAVAEDMAWVEGMVRLRDRIVAYRKAAFDPVAINAAELALLDVCREVGT